MVDTYNLDTIVMFNFTHINVSCHLFPSSEKLVLSIPALDYSVNRPSEPLCYKSESGTNLVMFDVH